MKKTHRIYNFFNLHGLLFILILSCCLTPSIQAADYSNVFYMRIAISGCDLCENRPNYQTACCWTIMHFTCDGSLIDYYETGCREPISNPNCGYSCASSSQLIGEHNPYYSTVPCEPQDCCKEEELHEGSCCPPGKPKCPKEDEGNPISVISGNNKEVEIDLEFDTPHGKGFRFYRTYKSRSEVNATLGYGWTHNYNVVLEIYDSSLESTYRITDESGRYHYYEDLDSDGIYVGFLSTRGYLVAEPDDTFTWYRPNDIKYTFDQQLQLITKEDANGNVQSIAYDTNNQLESVSDESTDRSIGFAYNAEGRIDHITGPITPAVPDGIWVSYAYDTNGNLTRVTYADDDNGSTASGFEYKYEDNNDVHNLTEKSNLAGEFLSSWQYDNSDRAYSNTTRDGKGVTITYNASSAVVVDAQGVQKTYTFETINGRKTITSVTGDSGCASCGGNDVVRYAYDDQRRVIEQEYANGRIDQYDDFDASDRYHTEIQAVGTPEERTFHYTYHPDTGEQLSIIESSILGSGDRVTIFDYDDDGNTTPNEDPTGLVHRRIERGFTFDANGAVTPYAHVTRFTYTAKGQVASVDGPLPGSQDLVTHTYDPVTGDRLTQTRPLAGTTTYTYDAAGNVATVTDPNGIVTTITYDGRNRQLSTTRNGIPTSRTYTAGGELATTTDALDRTMDYTYNDAGFMEKIIDPSGNFIYYGYNTLGQRIEESLYSADNTQAHYRGTDYGDPAANSELVSGKPWKSIHRNADDSADLETVYAYDNSGNLTAVTDAAGNTTFYTYDPFNRLTQVTQPGNATTFYTYDTQGNLAGVTDAESHVTTYTHDDLGRLVETDSPDTGTTWYSYDEAGNLRYKVQNANIVEYRYDVLGRLTQIIYSDTTENVTMTYDTGTGSYLIGRLASVTDPAGLTEYSYDADGNLEMETRTINGIVFVTGYAYDDAGNLRSITYPTGQTVDYQPDAADPARIGAVVLNPSGTNQSLASAIAYKPFGPVAAMALGNGIAVTQTHDKNYQLLAQTAGAVLDRTYSPDNVGNIQGIIDNLDPARNQNFNYDDLYRLTSAHGIYGTVSFTYDKAGNRLSRARTAPSESSDTYTYHPGTNRLQAVTGTHAELLRYDADGNTTQRIPGSANTQTPVSDPADYIYNTSGQRTQKLNTNPVTFHYDLSGQLIAETNAAGNLIKAYVWLHGQPLAQILADGSIYYYHNDHLGTPQKMTDSTAALVWAADYLPFGQADVTIATVENNLRFAGQYYDSETGLHYNYHRHYDPKLGRYLRADPSHLMEPEGNGIPYLIPHLLKDPLEYNSYSYVQNNPTSLIDPFGLVSCKGNWKKVGSDRLILTTCVCYWACLPCFSSGEWDGNPRSLPNNQKTFGTYIHQGGGGLEEGDTCLCNKPGPETDCTECPYWNVG